MKIEQNAGTEIAGVHGLNSDVPGLNRPAGKRNRTYRPAAHGTREQAAAGNVTGAQHPRSHAARHDGSIADGTRKNCTAGHLLIENGTGRDVTARHGTAGKVKNCRDLPAGNVAARDRIIANVARLDCTAAENYTLKHEVHH